MELQRALKLAEESHRRRIEIRKKKAQDYAGDTDALQNFKKVALLLGALDIDISKSYGVALVYAVLKIDRICNLVFRQNTKNPANESLTDSIDDLTNYIQLFSECLLDDWSNDDEH